VHPPSPDAPRPGEVRHNVGEDVASHRPGGDISVEISPARHRAGAAPTVADVARVAGVSRQTISNVLNAPDRVRAETRERVERAIAELRYRPNRVAQSLRAQTSRMIGYRIELMHPHVLASIHDRLLHALVEAGREQDHHLLLFTAEDHTDEIANCVALHRAGAIDGVVLYGIDTDDQRPPALLLHGIPFAAFGRTGLDPRHPWVDVDNVAGTTSVVEHLVDRGHHRIGYVGWPDGVSPVGDRRAEGWRGGLDKRGLLAECHELDMRGEDSLSNGARLGGLLLDHAAPPTAIVAATDTLAAGVIRALHARGLTPGVQVAVVGFDDTPTATVLDLSSVRQPIEAVGHGVIRALLAVLAADPETAKPEAADLQAADPEAADPEAANPAIAKPAGQLLPPTLIVRASSAGRAPTRAPAPGM
jgi:DNA-binding LacI/PurR family transcriptional regulator